MEKGSIYSLQREHKEFLLNQLKKNRRSNIKAETFKAKKSVRQIKKINFNITKVSINFPLN
jgi:hypothetical protein